MYCNHVGTYLLDPIIIYNKTTTIHTLHRTTDRAASHSKHLTTTSPIFTFLLTTSPPLLSTFLLPFCPSKALLLLSGLQQPFHPQAALFLLPSPPSPPLHPLPIALPGQQHFVYRSLSVFFA